MIILEYLTEWLLLMVSELLYLTQIVGLTCRVEKLSDADDWNVLDPLVVMLMAETKLKYAEMV